MNSLNWGATSSSSNTSTAAYASLWFPKALKLLFKSFLSLSKATASVHGKASVEAANTPYTSCFFNSLLTGRGRRLNCSNVALTSGIRTITWDLGVCHTHRRTERVHIAYTLCLMPFTISIAREYYSIHTAEQLLALWALALSKLRS